jgi:hypothetical protein
MEHVEQLQECVACRPVELRDDAPPSAARVAADRQLQRAVQAGRMSAADIAKLTFNAMRERRLYVMTHPSIFAAVKPRHADIEEGRAPADPMSLMRGVKRETYCMKRRARRCATRYARGRRLAVIRAPGLRHGLVRVSTTETRE